MRCFERGLGLFRKLLWKAGNQKLRRGLWVVLLGPDGAGKSSVIAGLGRGVSAGFKGCETFHLRPPLLGRSRGSLANTNPHGQTARGTCVTVCKLIYLLVLNWLAYFAVVRPRVARGVLVLFDRYFSDCVIDAKRYRLPESCRRLTRLVARLVPQPDLCIVLDVPPRRLWERKREVLVTELLQLCHEYAVLGEKFSDVIVVDAAAPLPEVVNNVVDRIIERHLAEPTMEAQTA